MNHFFNWASTLGSRSKIIFNVRFGSNTPSFISHSFKITSTILAVESGSQHSQLKVFLRIYKFAHSGQVIAYNTFTIECQNHLIKRKK